MTRDRQMMHLGWAGVEITQDKIVDNAFVRCCVCSRSRYKTRMVTTTGDLDVVIDIFPRDSPRLVHVLRMSAVLSIGKMHGPFKMLVRGRGSASNAHAPFLRTSTCRPSSCSRRVFWQHKIMHYCVFSGGFYNYRASQSSHQILLRTWKTA